SAAFIPQVPFTVSPGQTVLMTDVFQTASGANVLQVGPVRLQVTTGNPADLQASVRTTRPLDNGATFGFEIPAVPATAALSSGASRTLFLGARGAAETAVLGFFSPKGCDATATLVSPNGTVRGTLRVQLDSNVAEEFNPAASAFGVIAEPGDVV